MTAGEMTLIGTIVGTGVGVGGFLFTVLRSMRKELADDINGLADDIKKLGGDVTQVRERVSALEGRIQVVSQLVMRSESE